MNNDLLTHVLSDGRLAFLDSQGNGYVEAHPPKETALPVPGLSNETGQHSGVPCGQPAPVTNHDEEPLVMPVPDFAA